MKLTLVNQEKRDRRDVSVGFDWVAFISTIIFGIPHFIRGQNVIGAIFLVLGLAGFFIPMPENEEEAVFFSLFILVLYLGLSIYMGVVGKKLYVKHLLANGYEFDDEASDIVGFYKQKWGIV